MQGGIIGVIKDIWETMKKEIKGPKITKISLDKEKIVINDTKLKKETSIFGKIFFHDLNIKDIKDCININIQNGLPKSEAKEIHTLINLVRVSSNQVLLKDIFTGIKNKKMLFDFFKIDSYEFYNIDISVKSIFIEDKVVKYYSSLGKIQKIPKKIYGVSILNIKKQELDDILSQMKQKFPRKNFSYYRINSIFKDLPVDSIKNLRYYKEINMLEIYFNKRMNNRISHLIILENRYSNQIEKIFL